MLAYEKFLEFAGITGEAIVEDVRTPEGDVETFFAQCRTCGLGGNCREADLWVRNDGRFEVWDTIDLCDTCRYVAEYGEEPEF